jgi:hypothetical protein
MKVDMSPKAVTVRLKRVSQLRRLCVALGKGKPLDGTSDSRSVVNAVATVATRRG